MAAPEYVPITTIDEPRTYASPPRRPASWEAARPGDLVGPGQPSGPLLGSQGPDLGYALKLAHGMVDQLVLAEREHLDDVIAGCTALAMKRSSLFGRAPVVHDLTLAFGVWGFLAVAPHDLVEFRMPLFAEVASSHHWAERRRLVDMVSERVLRQPHTKVVADAQADWHSVFDLPPAA